MINKEELRMICKQAGDTLSEASKKLGKHENYFHVNISRTKGFIGSKLALEVFKLYPNECRSLLPEHRVLTIEEYLENDQSLKLVE